MSGIGQVVVACHPLFAMVARVNSTFYRATFLTLPSNIKFPSNLAPNKNGRCGKEKELIYPCSFLHILGSHI
jgi:hypothetical protein